MKTESSNDDREMGRRLASIETLLHEVEAAADSAERARTTEIVRVLMEFHGAGLARLLERVAVSTESGAALINSLAQDELISTLLLLYGLHPLDLDARVRQALEKVHPYIHSHGGHVALLGTESGVVRLRLQGSCHGCPSSAVTLKQTIEEAIREQAPDVVSIEVEGETGQPDVADEARRVALPVLSG